MCTHLWDPIYDYAAYFKIGSPLVHMFTSAGSYAGKVIQVGQCGGERQAGSEKERKLDLAGNLAGLW